MSINRTSRPGLIAFSPTGGIDLTLQGRDAFTVGPQGQLIPKRPMAGQRVITGPSGVMSSTAPTPSFGDVIARQAAARLQAANRMRARQQQQAPQTPMQRLGQAFRQPITSPAQQGMLTAAATGLQLAGPQPVPTSTGQILGQMGMAGLQAFTKAKEAEEIRAAAARKEAREIAALNKPKFQVVGDRLFKIMPDGRYEDITGDEGPKAPKIKSEGDRYYYDDRVIKTLIADDGSVYEAGNIQAGPLDMNKATLVDPFTTMDMKSVQKYKEDNIRAPQKTLQIIDRLASQIEKGPSGFAERTRASISAKLKRLTQENPDYTEEELALALQQGTLTQLVGAARLELFGPGVMTEFEQAMAREILAGNFDNLTVQEAVNRLYQFRESFLPNYLDSIEFYNNQPIVRSGKMQIFRGSCTAFLPKTRRSAARPMPPVKLWCPICQ